MMNVAPSPTHGTEPAMNLPSAPDNDAIFDIIEPATLVRRAILASASELEGALAKIDPSERRRQKALDRWFSGFAAQVRRHHELIDTLVVPALAARGALDDRTLDTIADDHSYVDELLSDLGDALGVLSFGLGAEALWVDKARELAAALAHVLDGQLGREERTLTPLVEEVLDADERDVVAGETVRAVAHGPVRFSLAWLYAHVTDEERAAIDPHVPTTTRLVWRGRRGAYQRSSVAALG
jgi:Hemerythrin HHE cation binding domain